MIPDRRTIMNPRSDMAGRSVIFVDLMVVPVRMQWNLPIGEEMIFNH